MRGKTMRTIRGGRVTVDRALDPITPIAIGNLINFSHFF